MENTENNSNKPKSNTLLIILLALMIAIGGWLGYTNQQLKTQLEECGMMAENIEEEKGLVVEELEGMLFKYDSLETNNDSINTELLAEKERVEELLAQAKNNRYSIYKLKKETETLRGIMKGYVQTIDSLNTANIELRAENEAVRSQYNQEVSKNQELADVNENLQEKVKLGARLKALDMITQAQRVKNSGTHRETNRANKTEIFKTCFTLDRNKVIEAGTQVIYLRIISPKGKVLSEKVDDSQMFQMGEKRGLYSVKKTITYENKELDICMYKDNEEELPAGKYMIECWNNGVQIGEATLELK